jgi:hypothetical protein
MATQFRWGITARKHPQTRQLVVALHLPGAGVANRKHKRIARRRFGSHPETFPPRRELAGGLSLPALPACPGPSLSDVPIGCMTT